MKLKATVGVILTLSLALTLFAVTPISAAGAPIKIGVIADKSLTEGLSLWNGVEMAKDEINAWHGGQGVYNATGTGDYHKIQLVYIDEHAYPLRPDLAVAELVGALPLVDWLVGGFRSECAFPMREAAADYFEANNKPMWTVTGCATTRLIDCGFGIITATPCGQCVRCDYPRYKFLSRATPMNDTYLFGAFSAFIREYLLGQLPATGFPYPTFNTPGKLARMYQDPVPTYLVMENLVWTDTMLACLLGSSYIPASPYPTPPNPAAVLGNHCVLVGTPPFSRPAWDAEDFTTTLNAIEASGAKLVIHVFSALAGASFIKQFGQRQIEAVAVGINVESQLDAFWTISGGFCEYESFLASMGTRSALMPTTPAFWDAYIAKFGDAPVYTGLASHDATLTFAENLEAINTLDVDIAIPYAEQRVRDGLLGRFKYTGPHPGKNPYNQGYDYDGSAGSINNLNPTRTGGLHDVWSYETGATWSAPKYVRTQIPQWIAGKQEVVWPRDQAYSKRYTIPPWMWETAGGYSIADTDWAGTGPVVIAGPTVISPYLFPDGIVDIVDITSAAAYWLELPAYYALEADINGDGLVDIYDVSRMGKDWHKTAA